MSDVDLMRAREFLAKVDCSKLPYSPKISLITEFERPLQLVPPTLSSHYIRSDITVPHVVDGTLVILTNITHIIDITSLKSVQEAVLTSIFQLLIHEMCENIIIDGKRKLDPHAVGMNFSWNFTFNEYDEALK